MKTRLFLLACLVGTATVASAQQSASPDSLPSVTLPPELDRVLRDYEQGWRNRDAEALADLFTSDGFVLRPSHPPVRGRAAIAEAYQGSGGPLHLRAYAFTETDLTAHLIGGYRGSESGPDMGKFILLLQRGPNGQWLIAADMDNGNG